MSHRNLLLSLLKAYHTDFEDEQKSLQEIIAFVEQYPNCFERSNLKGHITGSAWLLSPDGQKVLLTHHKKLNRWLQPGGHSDGDPDTRHVALREATEESGIFKIDFVMRDIFDVDVHTIPENPKKNEPEHKHYDVRFLLRAGTEDFVVSEESHALKWADKNDLYEMEKAGEINGSITRMAQKYNLAKKKINDKIIFLTGNPHKKEIAETVLSLYGLEVEARDIDLEEIQETDIEKIAVWSAQLGAKRLNMPVIKTDVGFSFDALGGFPGAFGKYVFPQLGVGGILRLMEGKENRHATSTEVLAFALPDGTAKTWTKVQDLEILTTPKGTGSVMDQVMLVVGEHTINYGSMTHDEKMAWWRKGPNYFHDFAKWYVEREKQS